MAHSFPDDCRYSESHEYVRPDGDLVRLGISSFAVDQLGDIVFVELPAKGRQVKSGVACAVVESVKTASDIYSPVSGEVIEINPAVTKDPSLVNSDPYATGWFFKVRLAASGTPDDLLTPQAYAAQIGA